MKKISKNPTLNIKKITSIFNSNDIGFAAIFGSYAKGKANKKSDLDLLIRFSKPRGLLDLVRLERELSERLKIKVDLLTERSLSPYLKDDILNDLKIIYGKR